LALAQALLPLQVGPINDYGQTLEAEDRGKLLGYIAALEAQNIQLVYLASWRDPFSDPKRYAAEVFRAWALSERTLLLVFVRDENRRWHVAIQTGSALALPEKVEELRKKAETEANRMRPGYAAVHFVSGLLAALSEAQKPQAATKNFPWKPTLLGGVGLFLLFLFARRICPRCGRPLRRVRSVSGIIWVCPRCRYTRAGLRWGRWPGGRGDLLP